MKRIAFVVVLLLGTSLIASPAAFAASCSDRLDNNVYTCTVKASTGLEYGDTLTFTTSPFTLSSPAIPFATTCSCRAVGSFKNPVFFGDDKHWVCLGSNADVAISLSGNVKGGSQITEVAGTMVINAINATPEVQTLVFSCTGP